MYAVVDIETTGNGYRGQKITEISIFIFDGTNVIDEFTTLVNPEAHIPPFITNLTGITAAMVQNQPRFFEIAKKVNEITKDCIFVAHNVNFDYNIIQAEFKNLGFDWQRKKLCTVRLSRKIMPGLPSYSLGNICTEENIPINGRHRARGDVEATVELFKRLILRDQNFTINSFLNPTTKPATLPPLLKKATVDTLSEKHGVYFFKNSDQEVIYIGQANNIKQQVISHFYDKKKKSIAMCEEIADLTFTETGSELLALLQVSEAIKEQQPKYNTAQKRKRKSIGLFTYENQKGIIHFTYNTLKLVANPIAKFDSVAACKKQLEQLCSEFNLCPKYCHLQSGTEECFHDHPKNCKGICCDQEPVEDYNLRVQKAMNSLGIGVKDIVIKENGRTDKEIGFVLVLNGTYQGCGYMDTNQANQLENPEDFQFFITPKEHNNDVENIITTYLKSN